MTEYYIISLDGSAVDHSTQAEIDIYPENFKLEPENFKRYGKSK